MMLENDGKCPDIDLFPNTPPPPPSALLTIGFLSAARSPVKMRIYFVLLLD